MVTLYSRKVVISRLALALHERSGIPAEKLTFAHLPESMDLSSSNHHSTESSSISDAALLNDLETKQSSALGLLYERYGSVIYGVALKVLQNQAEAEDLTQEIFLALWQHPVPPAKQGHLLRYLIAMTRTRAIDKLRSRSRSLTLVQRWGDNATAAPPRPTPVDQAVADERSQQVRQALAQLSDKQRQVIELAYDAGLSHSEIAQQMRQPLGSVKSWTRQGLLKLKQLLQDNID
jgi:RNA polymerase sigma-70 factor (ECF subfamily)